MRILNNIASVACYFYLHKYHMIKKTIAQASIINNYEHYDTIFRNH